MKPKMNILICLLVMLCASCEKMNRENVNTVYVLTDVTSTERIIPDFGKIQAELGLSDNSRGALYKIGSIEDVDYAPVVTLSLKPEPALLQNPMSRRTDVEVLLGSVRATLDSFRNITGDKPASSVFKRVAMFLNDLSEKCGSRVLYVCSDLTEHDALDFYSDKDLQTLYRDPKEIKKAFAAMQPLEDLSGIVVVFCYVPKSAQDNKRYSALIKVYADLITEKHGSVRMDGFDHLSTEKP